jgi:hypothetical protein
LWRINPRTPEVLSCEQQIIALSKVCNVNKSYALEHMNVVFPRSNHEAHGGEDNQLATAMEPKSKVDYTLIAPEASMAMK